MKIYTAEFISVPIRKFFIDIDSLFLTEGIEVNPVNICELVTLFHKVKHMLEEPVIYIYHLNNPEHLTELTENRIFKLTDFCQLYGIELNIGKFDPGEISDRDIIFGTDYDTLNIPEEKDIEFHDFFTSREIDSDFNLAAIKLHGGAQSMFRAIYFFHQKINGGEIC